MRCERSLSADLVLGDPVECFADPLADLSSQYLASLKKGIYVGLIPQPDYIYLSPRCVCSSGKGHLRKVNFLADCRISYDLLYYCAIAGFRPDDISTINPRRPWPEKKAPAQVPRHNYYPPSTATAFQEARVIVTHLRG